MTSLPMVKMKMIPAQLPNLSLFHLMELHVEMPTRCFLPTTHYTHSEIIAMDNWGSMREK